MPRSTRLADIRPSGPLRLLVARKRGKNLESHHVNVTTSVGNSIRSMCSQTVERLSELTARPYDADAAMEAEEYFVLARTEIPDDHPVMVVLESSDTADLLTAGSLAGETFWFYAIVFDGARSGHISFIRKSNPHYVAKRGNLFTLLGDSLARLEQPLFTFDDRFDAIVAPTTIFVAHQTGFELLFRDSDFITSHIPEWIDAITDHLPIDSDGAQQLADAAARDSRLSRRLRSISARGYLRRVSVTRLRKEILAQGLDPALFIRGGKLTFQWEQRFDLLSILNEDLFTGGLSGIHYHVDRKATRT